jgi:hypothetical protein
VDRAEDTEVHSQSSILDVPHPIVFIDSSCT